MKKKVIGILLILIALVIGGIAIISYRSGSMKKNDSVASEGNKSEDKSSGTEESKVIEDVTETEDIELPEVGEGAPDRESYIEQVQMQITGLSEEAEACIVDRASFDYEIKKWLYEHDMDHATIQSLNTVTFYYDRNCCEFMLQTEDNQVFCIQQNLE